MLKRILIGAAAIIVVVVAVVLVIAMNKPDEFSVQRTASINAPPEKIFAYIDDFHKWTAWSPYEHRDPNLQRTFSGAPSGKGSIYEWTGNSEVGQGRMEILESSLAKVAIQLDFIEPMEARNKAEFILQPKGGATEVSWVMSGPSNLMYKVASVFMDMDKMIGADFEKGLADLKKVSEQ